jgi:YD repeat-containing protein
MHIIYIHGANATPKSFSFIKSRLDDHTVTELTYDASDHLQDIINAAVKHVDQPSHIVSHSLGGIIGVALSHLHPKKIQTVTTISTPFGGSEAADHMSMLMPFNVFFRNIRTTSPILRSLNKVGPIVPTLNIITTEGQHVLVSKPNDGVVTIESQKEFAGYHIEFPFNHFEVLMDQGVAETIKGFISLHTKSP